MAIRNIVKDGDPLLRKTSKPVLKFDDKLGELLDDMYETMIENNGVGIAAPQIGVLRRVFIVEVNNIRLECVNPEIVKVEGEDTNVEGCLSCPGKRGYVKRPAFVTLSAYDREGFPFTITATDYLGRAIMHENDHLNGILFIDKVEKDYKEKGDK